MSNADAVQHGGQHYKTKYQHWNLLPEIGFGPEYYLGCATKYITRHASKNGAEDVRKAIHFMQKLIELIENGDAGEWRVPGTFSLALSTELTKFVQANNLSPFGLESAFIRETLVTGTVQGYRMAIRYAQDILRDQYDTPDPSEATPAYVDQDRQPWLALDSGVFVPADENGRTRT